jgi:hypothetical protein
LQDLLHREHCCGHVCLRRWDPMELLLNLLWLTLVLPGIWMWRREPVQARHGRQFRRIRPILLFACVLLLLFPVVSATDDLHALRQEVEESGPSKRLVKPVAGDKSPVRLVKAGVTAALVFVPLFAPSDKACGRVWMTPAPARQTASFEEHASRAPPSFVFGVGTGFAA